jgi:hypothetical protein
LLLTIFRKKSHYIQENQQQENNQPNPKVHLQQLKNACDNNDSSAARKALLAWAQCYSSSCANLNQLSQRAGGEMEQAITQLNQRSYSAAPSQWNGQELWHAVSVVNIEALKVGASISALVRIMYIMLNNIYGRNHYSKVCISTMVNYIFNQN